MSDATDEELVSLARDGNKDAFAELTRRHAPTCLKRAFLILRNHTDAEDEVQNAFAKAFEHLDGFRLEGPFSAWLCRIVRNQCLMRIRERREAEFVYLDANSNSNVGLKLVNLLRDQEDDMGRRQVMNLLQREISRVPPLMRNVVLLRDVEGLPMRDVAAKLGVSVPAAKSRLMRARKELRDRIVSLCGRSGPRTLIPKASPLISKSTPNNAEYS